MSRSSRREHQTSARSISTPALAPRDARRIARADLVIGRTPYSGLRSSSAAAIKTAIGAVSARLMENPMLEKDDADLFAAKLAAATARVVEDYADGDVVHEEPFSDQLCGRLKETLQSFETPNVRWHVDVAIGGEGAGRLKMRSLTKYKEEPLFGADLVMVLDLQLRDYSVRKGLLAQSKKLEIGDRMTPAEWGRLREQCQEMIEVTPASMVFLYSKSGVMPVSAAAVLAYKDRDLHRLVHYDIGIFYKDFAICWFGDPLIQATDPASLEALRILTDARAAVRFTGMDRGTDTPELPPAQPPAPRAKHTKPRRRILGMD